MHSESRRKFLRQTFFGSLALSSSRILPTFPDDNHLPGEIAQQLKFFSPHEFLVMEAISDRIIGHPSGGNPSAKDLDTTLRADIFLAGAEPEIQDQIHQLLTVFNAPFFTFLFDFRFSSFLNMNEQDQGSYLEDWMTSSLGFRRTAFQALKRICLSMFYTE